MGKHYIKDKRGKDVRTSTGERLFWSDRDGDSNPKQRCNMSLEGLPSFSR
jgi:hypothetical protein